MLNTLITGACESMSVICVEGVAYVIMAKKEINTIVFGNNKIDTNAKEAITISPQIAKLREKDNARIYMNHLANALLKENAISDNEYKKLLAMIEAEVNRRYGK